MPLAKSAGRGLDGGLLVVGVERAALFGVTSGSPPGVSSPSERRRMKRLGREPLYVPLSARPTSLSACCSALLVRSSAMNFS